MANRAGDTGSRAREVSTGEVRCVGELASDLPCAHIIGGDVAAYGLADCVPLRTDVLTVLRGVEGIQASLALLRRCGESGSWH